MEVHVKPEVQAKLDQLVRESDRPTDELLEEAIVGYFDEVNNTRPLLDGRYDDLENGNVKLIDGNEIRTRLRAKSAARLSGRS